MTENDGYIRDLIEREGRQVWTRPCTEMVDLRALLDAAGIGWHDATAAPARNAHLWRTVSDAYVVVDEGGRKVERKAFVVTWGLFTYGGTEGLLEALPWTHAEPIGNLTATQAFEVCMRAVQSYPGAGS